MSGLFPILRPFGVEITRTGRDTTSSFCGNATYNNPKTSLSCKIKGEIKKLYGMDLYVHEDPGVIELSSPVMCDYDELKKIYGAFDREARKRRLVPNNEVFWGGGGHVTVNFGKTGEKKNDYGWKNPGHVPEYSKFIMKLSRFMAENPYICWAFGDPGDNHTHVNSDLFKNFTALRHRLAEAMLSIGMAASIPLEEFNSKIENVNIHEWNYSYAPFRIKQATNIGLFLCNKLTADREDLGMSVEYRFFGTAVDWEMQLAHVEFAQAMTEHVANDYCPSVNDPRKNFHRMRRSKDLCLKSFENLINKLGLDWKRYSRFREYIELRHDVYGKDFLN